MEKSEPDLIDLNVRVPRALMESVILHAVPPAGDVTGRRLALARWILASRRLRPGFFRSIRLGDPNWDMILHLYVADREGRSVDVSGLCLASGVPPTTALRYVELLVAQRLVAKVDDVNDGRRALVSTSAALRAEMDGWLDQAGAGLRVAGGSAP